MVLQFALLGGHQHIQDQLRALHPGAIARNGPTQSLERHVGILALGDVGAHDLQHDDQPLVLHIGDHHHRNIQTRLGFRELALLGFLKLLGGHGLRRHEDLEGGHPHRRN